MLSFPLAAVAAGVAYAAVNMLSGADAVVFVPLAMSATAIAFAHALVLGVPVALVLSRLGALTLANTLTAASTRQPSRVY